MSDDKAVLFDVNFYSTVLEVASFESWAYGWVEEAPIQNTAYSNNKISSTSVS